MPPDQLPPLESLKVLESCVRNRNFGAAASELNIPAQTVSQQIGTLEQLLETALFNESGRNMEPTEAATALADYVRSGLDSFAAGIAAVNELGDSAAMNLTVSPDFADRHLHPKLGELRQSHPEIEVRLTTWADSFSVVDSNSAIAILHGYGDWQNSQWTEHITRRLIVDHKIVCCSASLMKGDYPIRRASALCGYPLLQTTQSRRMWQSVLSYLEIDHPDPDGGLTFPDEAALHEATAQGLGIGLISRADAAEGISSGRLIAPLGEAALSGMAEEEIPGFYLVYPEKHRLRPQVQNLCDWLCEQQWSE